MYLITLSQLIKEEMTPYVRELRVMLTVPGDQLTDELWEARAERIKEVTKDVNRLTLARQYATQEVVALCGLHMMGRA